MGIVQSIFTGLRSKEEDEQQRQQLYPFNIITQAQKRSNGNDDEGLHYFKQMDVIIDVPSLDYQSLARRYMYDVVDSACLSIEKEENEVEEVEEEEVMINCCVRVEGKWIKHYHSSHRILLVGEGNFSFSASLALAFGTASNMIATSLDSRKELITKYKNADFNLILLKYMGASIFHELDATKMKHHYDLVNRKFDRIIYNFPHAGFHGKESNPSVIMKHRNLVSEFFRNASDLLQESGEIHVSHKTTHPFNTWNIQDLAAKHSLKLSECVDFKIEDYPDYKNKKGAGPKCDDPFPLGKCSTFKFILCIPEAKRVPSVQVHNAALFDRRPPSFPVTFVNDVTLHAGLSPHLHARNECIKIFGGYLYHVEQTFGRTDYDVYGPLNDALRLGFEKFAREIPARPFDDYIDILEQLHDMSTLRLQRLRYMLSALELPL